MLKFTKQLTNNSLEHKFGIFYVNKNYDKDKSFYIVIHLGTYSILITRNKQ